MFAWSHYCIKDSFVMKQYNNNIVFFVIMKWKVKFIRDIHFNRENTRTNLVLIFKFIILSFLNFYKFMNARFTVNINAVHTHSSLFLVHSLSGVNSLLDVVKFYHCCEGLMVKVLIMAQKFVFKSQLWHDCAKPLTFSSTVLCISQTICTESCVTLDSSEVLR